MVRRVRGLSAILFKGAVLPRSVFNVGVAWWLLRPTPAHSEDVLKSTAGSYHDPRTRFA